MKYIIFFLFLLGIPFSSPAKEIQSLLSLSHDRVAVGDSSFQSIDKIHERSRLMEEILVSQRLELDPIKKELSDLIILIESLEITVGQGGQYLDMNSLTTFDMLLEESSLKLDGWRKQLLSYDQHIGDVQADIERIKQAKLSYMDKEDQLFFNLYDHELARLDSVWQRFSTTNHTYQRDLNDLQLNINRRYYQVTDLQRKLSLQMQSYSIRTFSKESNYIWQRAETKKIDQAEVIFSKVYFKMNEQIVLNYFKDHFLLHILSTSVLFLIFFFWVRRNYRKVTKLKDGINFVKNLEDPHTISAFPVLSSFMVVFSLWPFLDLGAPQAYMMLMQIFYFVVTSIFVFRYSSRKEKRIWSGLWVLFIAFILVDANSNLSLLERLTVLFVNVFVSYCCSFFLNHKNGDVRIIGITRKLLYILIVVNMVAFVMNVFGRVTISTTLTNASLIGFIQVIALSIFKDIVVSAIQLHNIASSAGEKRRSFLDMEVMSVRIFKLLSGITLFLSFAVFTANLNLYDYFHSEFFAFLFKERTISSTTFTIGNILLFFLVIYLSMLAQRYVGYLFGESSDEVIPEGKKGSKIVIWKLIIILLGIALAIAVSGLPLDKVTIVLSAFGVGVGLGLQNVVNNFVSGLIVIFERPLQVGDYVEIGNLKGWVKNIGIRATRMVNNDGAEIIVPNGSILAGNLTNWTLSSSKVRVEINLKISPPHSLELAKEIILDVINQYEYSVQGMRPDILQTSLNDTNVELRVSFWIDHVNRQDVSKSFILNSLYLKFKEKDITMI